MTKKSNCDQWKILKEAGIVYFPIPAPTMIIKRQKDLFISKL